MFKTNQGDYICLGRLFESYHEVYTLIRDLKIDVYVRHFLLRLTFTFYNWKARHAQNGQLQTSNINSDMKRLRRQSMLPISDNGSVTLQGVFLVLFLVLLINVRIEQFTVHHFDSITKKVLEVYR